MKCKILTGGITRSAFAVGLLIGAFSFQSCSDDLLTGQPSWLGNSIYEELQNQGNYTYTLRLIDDLGLTEQMSHTGSLTILSPMTRLMINGSRLTNGACGRTTS